MVTLLPDTQSEILVRLEDLHSLQDAHIPGSELAQRPLREAQIISLMMADPASVPAIVVTRTKEYGLIIIDGYHREEAAKRRKDTEIRAIIRAFATENEVIEAAFQANIGHGLPASTTTRSDYAYWLFTTHPDVSQKEIARRVGVKPSTVNIAIKRRERERRAREEKQKERDFYSGWSQKDLDRGERQEEEEKQLAQLIRTYVRHTIALYEQLRHLDNGARYWALEKAISEGEKLTLARMCQYIEHYIKESLPPDLVKSLKPSQPRRTKQSNDTTTPEGKEGQ